MPNERKGNNFSERLNDLANALNGQVKISNGFRKRSNDQLEFSQRFFRTLLTGSLTTSLQMDKRLN